MGSRIRAQGAGAMKLYVALVHYPVYDKNGRRIASAITTFDLHDLSRAARTLRGPQIFCGDSAPGPAEAGEPRPGSLANGVRGQIQPQPERGPGLDRGVSRHRGCGSGGHGHGRGSAPSDRDRRAQAGQTYALLCRRQEGSCARASPSSCSSARLGGWTERSWRAWTTSSTRSKGGRGGTIFP